MTLHEGEVEISAGLVRELVATQFPELAGEVTPVRSTGTVNAIYRLGERWYVRLPRVAAWAQDLEKEWEWLPRLAPRLSLRIPTSVRRGEPTDRYPFTWAIYEWLEGEPYADGLDERRAAADLARFVRELRVLDASGAPRAGRPPLRELDPMTREAIAASHGIDREAAQAAWERALRAPVWDGERVWIHCDLLRPNILVRDGRVSAVIDFGSVGAGDPATDLIAAWAVFGPVGRAAYHEALEVDDGTWERGRGIALHQAAMIIPYYRETNPGFVALAQRTIEQILGPWPGS